MTYKIERRFMPATEVRAEGSGKNLVLCGYAATFGTVSHDLGGFREVLSRGCFSRALRENQDVIANINHSREPERILGRTTAGTLDLKEDARGLKFRCDLPDTQAARDAHAQVRAGNISGCSFAFTPQQQRWDHNWQDKQGQRCSLRYVDDLDLFDVSPIVTDPAYPDTDVDTDDDFDDRSLRLYFPQGIPVEVRAHVPGLNKFASEVRANRRRTTNQILGW